jgi:hypothetical protein
MYSLLSADLFLIFKFSFLLLIAKSFFLNLHQQSYTTLGSDVEDTGQFSNRLLGELALFSRISYSISVASQVIPRQL